MGAVGQQQRGRAVPDDVVHQRGFAAARIQAIGRSPAAIVVKEAHPAAGVNDHVVDQERVALVQPDDQPWA